MKLSNITREQFERFISSDKGDKFAKTFVAKCNMMKGWQFAIGAWEGEELCGAVVTTISKRKPPTANLQLLHTFVLHRKKGIGRALCEYSLKKAVQEGAQYFRVSSEPESVEFYRRCGMKFWGKQKSGCSLCMFKINGSQFAQGIYEQDDHILSQLFSGRKGQLTSPNTPLCAE